MAGRGCTVCVTILGGSESKNSDRDSNDKNEELSLPVALHSPLSVLKEQLEELTGIAMADQVLILCDLSDIERNNDKLLEGRDYMTLRECGIRNGCVMTLHALGLSAERYAAERKSKMQKLSADGDKICVREEDKTRILETKITAARADHSYNGVLFDVKCNGPFEVDLLSVSVGGMLGRVRIFARDRPCEADKPERGSSPHWWAHRESVSNIGWTMIADVVCRPSWDKPLEIKFDQPVTLLPHSQRGLYCHSSLPDDLGIQYQSYQSKESIVAKNEHITLLAGLGHTGFEPFDEVHGWYRAWRGLSGAVSYRTKWKGWSPLEHKLFPKDLRSAVRAMLLCQNRIVENETEKNMPCKSNGERNDQMKIHRREENRISSDCASSSSNFTEDDSYMTNSEGYHIESLSSEEDSSRSERMNCELTEFDLRGLTLHLLPKYLIYNILEFMHWDWFEDVEDTRARVERAKMYAARALLGRERDNASGSRGTGTRITDLTSPYDNAGDDSIAGQQHRVMMMIAHAINNSQNGITIGGLHFQLSNETENNNNGNITADGGDVQGENNIVTANMSGGTTAQLFAGIMANSQNGINSSYQEDENQRNDYNDWAANEADGDGDDHDDNYYDMYETGNLGIEGVNYEREDEEEEENGFEEEEGDGEGGDDDNVSLS